MQEDSSDVVIECIEAFIHNILYLREVYPKGIFRRKRIYNTPIYVSIFPPLNEYILNVLETALELKRNKQLFKVKLMIYKDEFEIYENFIFEICDNQQVSKTNNNDYYLIEFEQELRKSLLLLNNKINILGKLPEEAIFLIKLETTQEAFLKLNNNPKWQKSFPWIQSLTETSLSFKNSEIDTFSILPVVAVRSTRLRFYVEKH